MHIDRGPEFAGMLDSATGTDDRLLIAGMLGGDPAALTRLMDRYDRLVRYTVFRAARDRCQRDPEWLDSVASATWAGFVRSMRRDPDRPPQSVRAYLVRIAANQVASEQRRHLSGHHTVSLEAFNGESGIQATMDEPIETLAKLEMLEAVRECLAELNASDRAMASQLAAITERRWRDAAQALGMKESTLRSRWKQTLERIAGCLRRKTGKDFAPGRPGDDS